MSNVVRDGLADEESQRFGDVSSSLRIRSNKSSDLGSQSGDLESFGKMNRDGRVDRPSDSSDLT